MKEILKIIENIFCYIVYTTYLAPRLKHKNMSKQRKLIDVNKDDVHTLAVHALTTKNISFKVYAEKLLSDKAKQLRKKSKQTV